jgi:hypothetical protein
MFCTTCLGAAQAVGAVFVAPLLKTYVPFCFSKTPFLRVFMWATPRSRPWGHVCFSYLNALFVLMLVVRFPRLLVECVESIPEVASVGMLVWIGVIVTAEAFKQKKYHSAVVVGIIPALASSLSTSNMTSSGMESLGEGYMPAWWRTSWIAGS